MRRFRPDQWQVLPRPPASAKRSHWSEIPVHFFFNLQQILQENPRARRNETESPALFVSFWLLSFYFSGLTNGLYLVCTRNTFIIIAFSRNSRYKGKTMKKKFSAFFLKKNTLNVRVNERRVVNVDIRLIRLWRRHQFKAFVLPRQKIFCCFGSLSKNMRIMYNPMSLL